MNAKRKLRIRRAVKKSIIITAIMIAIITVIGVIGTLNRSKGDEFSSVDTNNKPDETLAEESFAETEVEKKPSELADGESMISSTGHELKKENGILYADGIPIVNKVYSIPKEYAPKKPVSAAYDIEDFVYDAYEKMNAEAKKAGCDIVILSGYRSYDRQVAVHNREVNLYGEDKADSQSAQPGFSEHQTGLCMDVNDLSKAFGRTQTGKWLANNCWRYGFCIRYREDKIDKTGYDYEPWHIRYVGDDIARELEEKNMCIEEYFGLEAQ